MTGGAEELGDAKVGQFDGRPGSSWIIGHQQVGWFEVAVDDAVVVGHLQ